MRSPPLCWVQQNQESAEASPGTNPRIADRGDGESARRGDGSRRPRILQTLRLPSYGSTAVTNALGTPLTLALLEFFHPLVSRDVAGTLFPVAGWWVTLHVVQLVLFALMGAALWLLTDGLHGIATTVSRLGAAVFVVFYGAGDTLMGIATGILAQGR